MGDCTGGFIILQHLLELALLGVVVSDKGEEHVDVLRKARPGMRRREWSLRFPRFKAAFSFAFSSSCSCFRKERIRFISGLF